MKYFWTVFFLIPIHLFSQSPQKLNNEGADLLDSLKFSEALALFNKAIESDSITTIYRLNRAVALTNLNMHKEAIADYLFIVSKIEDDPEYFFQLGDLYEKVKNPEKSIVYYTKAIDLYQEDYTYFFQRGTLYLKKKDFALAVADYDQVLKINPESHNALHNRGIAQYKLGHEELACMDWCAAKIKGNEYSGKHLEINCKKIVTSCTPKK
jgi:tetratricopeptide (TPR) repeat protein